MLKPYIAASFIRVLYAKLNFTFDVCLLVVEDHDADDSAHDL